MSCGSSNAHPPRAIPDLGQVTEDDFEPARPDVRDVFQEEDSRSYDANCFKDVDPNSRASASNSNPVPRNRDVLAGEPCGDHVDQAHELSPVDLADVAEVGSVRVPLSEDGARAWRAFRHVDDAPADEGSDSHADAAVPCAEFEDLQAGPPCAKDAITCVRLSSSFRWPPPGAKPAIRGRAKYVRRLHAGEPRQGLKPCYSRLTYLHIEVAR